MRTRLILYFLAVSAAACQTSRTWPIPLTPCKAAGGRSEGFCGTYEVFENRASRSGRKIKLNLMVLPTHAAKPQPDPVFLLAGGPGESAVQAFPGLEQQLSPDRDAVLVDQRGAGASNRLACDLDEGPAAAFSRLAPLDKLRQCRDQLEKTADLRQYVTSVAMDDLDEVRAALGYDRINVWGGSYGTTAGLDYLRRHGDHVRTLSLVAVVPPSFRVPLPFPHTVQKSLETIFARCDADSACHAAFPKFREEFEAVLARLDKAPAKFRFTCPPEIPDPVEITLSRDMFGDFLRRILYGLQGINLFPLAIHDAYNGDFQLFARLCYILSIRGQNDIPYGMYLSILCNESFPFISDAESAAVAKGTYIGDFRVRAQRAMCKDWPDAQVPRGFVEPVKSDRPVLLISGAFDPAGQPEYAAEAAKSLPHSLHLVSRDTSHGGGGACFTTIVRQFIEKGSAEGLDTSCVDQIPSPHFRVPDSKHSTMSAAAMAEYAGTYELAPGAGYTVRTVGGVLTLQGPGWPRGQAVFPLTENKGFMVMGDGEVEFVRDAAGKVAGMNVHLAARDLKMTRK
jgi:pimeloyl-ACP methyl ester carboxylesterase